MTNIFLTILNMSITASYVALAVIAARFLMRGAPKIFSYILWSAVLIRLIIPVSFTSNFSIFRLMRPQGHVELLPQNLGMPKHPMVDVGVRGINRFIHASLPAADLTASVNPMQIILWTGSTVWAAGAAILLLYSVVSYVKIKAKVRTATLVKDNLFETDRIATPFVCGLLKPKIYIPAGIRERDLAYILLHEQTHIRRRDYLVKPLAYMMLIVHWFNPIMWLSYSLMSKDMEMSCDERVIRKMGSQAKGDYSTTLLSLSIRRSGLPAGSPLAFGDGDVKARIKNILAYRQPSPWAAAVFILVIAVLVVGCTANPKLPQPSSQISSRTHYSGYDLDKLMKNKTLYIGNAGKVGGLIGGMPRPEGLEGKGMELQTSAQPYGLTVNYIRKDSSDVIKEGDIGRETFFRNSVLLFSLIDNVDIITYLIADDTGQTDGATHRYTTTREEVEDLFGIDVRDYSADEASLRRLIDRLDDLNMINYIQNQ